MTGLLYEPPVAFPGERELRQLREARRLIRRGWTQGSSHEERGLFHRPHYCVLGALQAVGALRFDGAAKVFRQANDIRDIPSWNDFDWRKKRDVLRAFDRAIAYVEEMQSAWPIPQTGRKS